MVIKRLLLSAAALALSTGLAHAQYSDNKVKIGVLTDLSGTYSDLAGQGNVVAAQLAIDDFYQMHHGKNRLVVFFYFRALMAVVCIFDREFVQAEFAAHFFKFGVVRIA